MDSLGRSPTPVERPEPAQVQEVATSRTVDAPAVEVPAAKAPAEKVEPAIPDPMQAPQISAPAEPVPALATPEVSAVKPVLPRSYIEINVDALTRQLGVDASPLVSYREALVSGDQAAKDKAKDCLKILALDGTIKTEPDKFLAVLNRGITGKDSEAFKSNVTAAMNPILELVRSRFRVLELDRDRSR